MVENNWGKSLAPSSFRHFIDQDSINHQVSQLRDVLWKYRGGKLSTDDDNKIKGIRERLNAHAQAHRELKDASSDARNAVSNLEKLRRNNIRIDTKPASNALKEVKTQAIRLRSTDAKLGPDVSVHEKEVTDFLKKFDDYDVNEPLFPTFLFHF